MKSLDRRIDRFALRIRRRLHTDQLRDGWSDTVRKTPCMLRRHSMIGHCDDVSFVQASRIDDFFEIAVGDLIGAFEILRITLTFGPVLESWLVWVREREFMASFVGLHLITHQEIELVIVDGKQHGLFLPK
jgi:hypothetical protein